MGGKHLTAFLIFNHRGRIAIVATLGESRSLFHCGEATDSFLIETAKANDGLKYCEHGIFFLSSSIVVVSHNSHSILYIVICQAYSLIKVK